MVLWFGLRKRVAKLEDTACPNEHTVRDLLRRVAKLEAWQAVSCGNPHEPPEVHVGFDDPLDDPNLVVDPKDKPPGPTFRALPVRDNDPPIPED